MQAERGATLVPAIGSNAWEQGISSRLVLFRNWARRDDDIRSIHFAGIQKLDGRSMPDVIGPVYAFDIQPVRIPLIQPHSQTTDLIREGWCRWNRNK